MQIIYWISLGALYYIYDGYLCVLRLMALFVDAPRKQPLQAPSLKVTVLITAYNEAAQITEKIRNTLDQEFPPDCLEVLVASDGSTDETDAVVNGIADPRVRLFRPAARHGKTATQNEAVRAASGEVIVFTDAGTRFEEGFLRELCAPFSDPRVGAADGHLTFSRTSDSSLSGSQGAYWSYELKLRGLESRLGLLAVASGACLAVRRTLFVEMDPAVGEDCILPLDVVLQGYKVVHVESAQALDRMDDSPEREFRTRVRMTARNWRGTWLRPALLNPIIHPGYAFSLWSHKLLRWLSPFFLIISFLSAMIIGIIGGGWHWQFMLIPGGLIIGGLTGWLADRTALNVPLLGPLHSFCIANLGFLIGVLKALFAKPITTYR